MGVHHERGGITRRSAGRGYSCPGGAVAGGYDGRRSSFGRWIQRRRQALHLTQAALASKVYCSTETIRKIEADARRPSPSIAAQLADQLALPPHLRAIFLKVAHAELAVDWLGAPTQISDPSS